MQAIVRLYSVIPDEIEKFLIHFFGNEFINISESSKLVENSASKSEKNNSESEKASSTKQWWQKEYPNPIEIVDIIGAYIENIEDYDLTMWISIDSGVFIKVTKENADELIRYFYERFPY